MGEQRDSKNLSYLEFYSGVGGWTMAMEEACRNIGSSTLPPLKRLGSFDHSDICNNVLHYNFPENDNEKKEIEPVKLENMREKPRKRKKGSKKSDPRKIVAIEKLTRSFLEEKKALIWSMSPPCQPHTRQHANQEEDMNDPRSKSFLHLCQMLREMDFSTLPRCILLENVIGFENSSSCREWRSSLKSRGYIICHLHLCPTQVGLPNDRPRYFCIAVLKRNQEDSNHMPKEEIQEEKNHHLLTWFSSKKDNMENLEETPTVNKCITPLEVNGPVDKNDMPPISTFLNEDRISQTNLLVPEKLVKSNAAWCFDIVLPTDKRSACFTHSYGKFVRGTGSVLFIGNVSSVTSNKDEEGDADDVVKRLKLVPPQERSFDEDWAVGLNLETNLRYFSGIEMARLMGFPVRSGIENTCERKIRQFAFPPDCTLKQQWKMIGNSLNVKVAAKVAEVGIRLISCTT